MVIPSAGDIVVLPFPFSDLSENKVRPAVVLARANKSDWMVSIEGALKKEKLNEIREAIIKILNQDN